MGNSSSTVFPEPIDSASSVPPDWAIGIIAAAAIVTLFWIGAILALVLYELFGRGQWRPVKTGSDNGRTSANSTEKPFPSSLLGTLTRDVSSNSLGTPPPPIPAPTQYDIPRPKEKGMLMKGLVIENENVKEFKLEKTTPDEDDVSLYSNDSSEISKEDYAKVVMSQSIRSDSVAAAAESVAAVTDVSSLDGSIMQDPPLAGMVLSRPVTVRQLGATIKEPGYIESEFRKLPVLSISNADLPAGTERKNRYTNVLPTPRTRVHLPQIFGHSNSDYINGNYIRGYMGSHGQYIATQGPLETTAEDFWRMILDNGTTVIVMATNFQERGIDKCSRYWPAQGSQEYGSVQVTVLQQTAHGTYNQSILQVQASGGVALTITHYRLTFWPHQGVPKDTKTLTDFLRSVKMADSAGPAVIHCSSGIGRTGVLLACDIGMQGLLGGDPKIDVLRIVSTLRQDRAGMVQTREQYRFIHEALYNVAIEEFNK